MSAKFIHSNIKNNPPLDISRVEYISTHQTFNNRPAIRFKLFYNEKEVVWIFDNEKDKEEIYEKLLTFLKSYNISQIVKL